MKLAFEDLYAQPADVAELYLAEWVQMAVTSRLEPMIDYACSVAEHWHGVLRRFTNKVSNGLLEAISSLVQAAKRRARGYRTTRNLKAIVYLAAASWISTRAVITNAKGKEPLNATLRAVTSRVSMK